MTTADDRIAALERENDDLRHQLAERTRDRDEWREQSIKLADALATANTTVAGLQDRSGS